MESVSKFISKNPSPKADSPLAESSDHRLLEPGYSQKTRMKGRVTSLLIRLWGSNLRVHTIGKSNENEAYSSRRPVLYVHWHGSQLVPLAMFRNRGIAILTSLSRDGDIQDISLKCLGFRTIRGSSSRGGAKALLSLIRIMKEGNPAAMAVDGPRGPYHVSKSGPVLLAQRASASVLPVGVGHSHCHYLKNWDRFEIPVPFSSSVLVIGEPFQIPEEMPLEEGAKLIGRKISECDLTAKEYLKP